MTKAIRTAHSRRNVWLFALLSLVFAYLSLLGATFNGVLTLLELQPFTLGLFGVLAASWLFMHWRMGWVWHRVDLDLAFLLWMIALVVSIAMNQDTWRRSVEGLWYMGLYISLWYILHDLLANRGLSRQLLAQSFLFAGLLVMLFGWYSTWLIIKFDGLDRIPRPSSLIGNPNAFGAYMLLLLPFGIVQTINAKNRLVQVLMGLYTLSAFLLLILSQSRGAWIGGAVAVGILLLMLLTDRKLLSIAALKKWWQQQASTLRLVLIAILIIVVLLGAFMAYFLIDSLTAAGRSIALRTYLWDAAMQMFRESPLWGKGFYTYGLYLPQYASIPSTQPQAHAHNIPFTIIAEMGLLGLIAIVVTVAFSIRSMLRNWKTVTGTERPYYLAGVAATFGFGFHHLLDTPSMMPVIAMAGLLMLFLATTPAEPIPFQTTWRKVGHPLGLIAIWLVLLIAGFWSSRLYAEYYAILRDVAQLNDCRMFESDDCVILDAAVFLEPAERLQPLIDADPNQPAYIRQQAYLYGFAATDGDVTALENAIAGYERYLELEPTHASGWANLAALYWQSGNEVQARSAIEQAILYAPDWEHFKRQRNIYLNILTDTETIAPPIPVLDGLSWSRFQLLREPLPEYLPQVGWGS
jgi:putative inorganic carbon (hco3(-)) transporter